MQILTSMSMLRHHETAPELLAQLFQLIPEGRFRSTPKEPEGFKLDLPESDPRVASVLKLLHDHGYKEAEYPDARQRLYRLTRRRKYEPSDLAAAPFCWLEYGEVRGSTDGERTDDGLLRLPHADVRKWKVITKVGPTFVVPDAVKRTLENSLYRGLIFRPTVQTKPRAQSAFASSQYQPGEPVTLSSLADTWWELASDTTIGPMHSVNRLALTPQREPLPSGTRGPGTFRNTEIIDDFRPIYARSSVDAVAAYDIVHTWEYSFRATDPEILVSPRLREALHTLQPACKWIPIEVINA